MAEAQPNVIEEVDGDTGGRVRRCNGGTKEQLDLLVVVEEVVGDDAAGRGGCNEEEVVRFRETLATRRLFYNHPPCGGQTVAS